MFHAAVLSGTAVSAVQVLVEAGADPSASNGAGETALSLAVLAGQWASAEVLVRSPGGAAAQRAVEARAAKNRCIVTTGWGKQQHVSA